jgi:hypothetical protein
MGKVYRIETNYATHYFDVATEAASFMARSRDQGDEPEMTEVRGSEECSRLAEELEKAENSRDGFAYALSEILKDSVIKEILGRTERGRQALRIIRDTDPGFARDLRI